jgi:ABC-type multidrug transport system fused ATPase/permease subunit
MPDGESMRHEQNGHILANGYRKSLGHGRPKWMKPFVEEPFEVNWESQGKQQLHFYLPAIILFALSAISIALQILAELSTPQYRNACPIASITLWGFAVLCLVVRRPRTGSALLGAVYFSTFLLSLVVVWQQWSTNRPTAAVILNMITVFNSLIAILITINMPLRDPLLALFEISKPFTPPTSLLRSPEDNLTLWQWMSVSWMSPLISIGSKRQLQAEDSWSLPYEFQHHQLHEAFRQLQGTVIRRLIYANWIDIVILTLLALLELAAQYSAPLILQQILRAMEDLEISKRPTVTWATVALVVRLIAAQSGVFSLWFGRRCYERSRGEMITMLYEKTLNRKIIGESSREKELAQEEDGANGEITHANLDVNEQTPLLPSSTTRNKHGISLYGKSAKFFAKAFSWMPKKPSKFEQKKPASMGKLLNLMKNDVYEVAQRFWEIQTLINMPVGLILSMALVWSILGWSCLFGVGAVIIAQILNAGLARIIVGWEKHRRVATDVRLHETSHFIEAIRHLRWYNWHPSWLARVMRARQTELRLKIVTHFLNTVVIFVNQMASGLLPVASFWAYTVLAGKELRVDVAFPAVQLFQLLQSNLRNIPGLITTLLNAAVAMGRLEDFMSEPDKTDDRQHLPAGEYIELRSAWFSWPGSEACVLKNISLSFPVGLTVVFGEVAAGKTALLQGLLGELDLRKGQLLRPGEAVGYCAQTPWLQSMTIRDNILFSAPFDDTRYRMTIEACELTSDLATFKNGDLSPIGENGIGLSGGQKARVALARAVYSQAKILMLDDPLSALDQSTAESIVTKCFNGPLIRDRTVILVTHRTDLCRHLAKQLVLLRMGSAEIIPVDDFRFNALNNSLQPDSKDVELPTTTTTDDTVVPEKFEEEEHRAHGSVQLAVYWEYIKAGKIRWWLLVLLSSILCRILVFAYIWFLKEWGEAYKTEKTFVFTSISTNLRIAATPLSAIFDRFPNPEVDVRPWLLGFFAIVAIQAFVIFFAEINMLIVTYMTGKRMFKDVMDHVSQATFRFYDITPIGRLMNRLTSDIGTVDGKISNQIDSISWQGIAWISCLFVIAGITPVFVLVSLTLTALFIFMFLQFLPTSQSLRRLEV